MGILNKNGRDGFNLEAYKLFDEPGKQLAYRTLRLIFPESEYDYEIVENYGYGDIKLTNKKTKIVSYVEVECRNPIDHKKNMLEKFDDTNITLKNGVKKLQESGVRGFCISLNMDDLGKPYASEFYVTKLSDLLYRGPSPNKRNQNEKFFKLLNHQVVKWVYNVELGKYIKQNKYKPRFYKESNSNDYYL